MVKQIFHIERFWKVIVYYNVDYDYFYYIEKELKNIRFPIEEMLYIKHNMKTSAYGVTISSYKYKTSIVLFNRHFSKREYISSIIHEAEHIKQAVLKYYDINDLGEPPAYTIGYIVKQMFDVAKCIVYDICH